MKDNLGFLSRISDTFKVADKKIAEVPKSLRVISAVTLGAVIGTACEPVVETALAPTERPKAFFGELKSANTDILDDFWSNAVIPDGVTKNEIRCLDISVSQKDFYFCAYSSNDGQRENWSMKVEDKVNGAGSWKDLTKVIKQGYNMEGEIISIAAWTLDGEDVIWYPEYQADWLKDSQNPNFGINFMPPSIFGKDVIPGYDRASGLGIRLPLKGNSANDPYSPENIFADIAYRTGYQIGGPTATETQTPTPEATATPTETPTPEVKQFPVCQIENFRDCPITVDDLFNGEYLRWLNTLSKPFDQSKIKQVPMQVTFGNIITYDTKTAPNFKDPATAPFRRDVTAGYASFQGIDYIVMPVEYFDPKHPDKNQWVITVSSMYWPGHNQEKANKTVAARAVYMWRKYMKVTAICNNDVISVLAEGPEDPLVKMTFDNNPDMAERFSKFMSGEDMGALSKPGVVLLNAILGADSDHWFE